MVPNGVNYSKDLDKKRPPEIIRILNDFFLWLSCWKGGLRAAGNYLWQKVSRALHKNINAIRLIMYTLSSISDKCWQGFLAEEDSGQIKQLQLKITDVTSTGSFLSAVWIIGRHLWGPGKWTHTGEHTHAHTHAHRASRLSDVSRLRSEKSSADISGRRGEAAAQSRFWEKRFSVRPWWGKHGCALSPHLLNLHKKVFLTKMGSADRISPYTHYSLL